MSISLSSNRSYLLNRFLCNRLLVKFTKSDFHRLLNLNFLEFGISRIIKCIVLQVFILL